ncbi:EthD family reductase [Sphingomonas koreensis]|nr:EthD family reductase [Sphingomonas koreensis]
MIVVTVTYPASPGSRFDWDYYTANHLPLVNESFGPTGMTGVYALKGLSAPDGGPAPYVAIANLAFPDTDAVQASFGGEQAAAVMGDISNFTDILPIVQINTQV